MNRTLQYEVAIFGGVTNKIRYVHAYPATLARSASHSSSDIGLSAIR
jgi:hypothetical protein